jgi:hypothetical protein
MLTAEILANKIQDILGSQYKILIDHAFNRHYTRAVNTPYGNMPDVDFKKLDDFADLIIGVLSVNTGALPSTAYRLASGMYDLLFWVPVDINFADKSGQLIKPPEFNFYGDMERLIEAVKGKTFLIDGNKVVISVSEPFLQSANIDATAKYKRLTFKVSGNFSVSDEKVTTGGDITIRFQTGANKYTNLTEIYAFTIGSTTDANAVLDAASIPVNQSVSQAVRGVKFGISDAETPETAEAFAILKNKAFGNSAAISEWVITDTKKRNMIHIDVLKRGAVLASFWGTLSVQFAVSDKFGFGAYEVVVNDAGAE